MKAVFAPLWFGGSASDPFRDPPVLYTTHTAEVVKRIACPDCVAQSGDDL